MISTFEAIVRSRGWYRRIIALLAGAFGALALAPVSFAPALVVTFCVAVWLLDGATTRRDTTHGAVLNGASLRDAFGAGWWVGFGYFLAGFWWLGSAFFFDPEFLWALPLGIVGLPLVLAIFTGCGFVMARLLWSPGAARILALAIGLGAADWARGHLLTGFPWNSFGMGLGGNLVTAQLASLIGSDGLNVVTVALFATPATLIDGRRWRRPIAAAAAGLALIIGFGEWRLSGGSAGFEPGATVRIMQPGLQPDASFTYDNKAAIVAHYIALSTQVNPATGRTLEDVRLLVWPESAFPFLLAREVDERAAIGAMLPPGTRLVTGAARETRRLGDDGRRVRSLYYNDIMVIGRGGTILDSYDKIHLVPFGEYLPFDSVLRRLGLHNFIAIPGGFEPGHTRAPLVLQGLPPAAPSICYEAIFTGAVGTTTGGVAPRFLLNVTNDGWFGRTPGPAQHFAQARLRTIEEGMPMIRGAATGISAIIDPYGRIVDRLKLGDEGILDGLIPTPISQPLAARLSKLAFPLCLMVTVLIWLLLCFRHDVLRRDLFSFATKNKVV